MNWCLFELYLMQQNGIVVLRIEFSLAVNVDSVTTVTLCSRRTHNRHKSFEQRRRKKFLLSFFCYFEIQSIYLNNKNWMNIIFLNKITGDFISVFTYFLKVFFLRLYKLLLCFSCLLFYSFEVLMKYECEWLWCE